jgi:hypothetical protein
MPKWSRLAEEKKSGLAFGRFFQNGSQNDVILATILKK